MDIKIKKDDLPIAHLPGASSFLPPVQGFHIDAGDFAAVHGFDVSEVGVDGMEGVFHFAGFRVFPANQFFERHAAFIMVLNNGSGFGDGGDGVFFHDDYGAVRNGRFHRVAVHAQQVFSFFQFTV